MSSELVTIPQIVCSLFPLYYIYNFDYSFTPENGTRVKIYVVSKLGTYAPPILTTKKYTAIQVIGSPFTLNLYPIAFGYEFRQGRRVMWVELVDDTFQLDNYYVALTGTACGFRIYPLGTPVDTRSLQQQLGQAIDPIQQQIKNFTQFIDVEYSFTDFLNLLKKFYTLGLLPVFDTTITKSFVGTFKSVLNLWCSFYNFSWFFENGKLNIIDPTKIIFNFAPANVPSDIIEYEYSESLEGTFGKTASVWYQQEGGEIQINGAGALLLTTSTLYPLGQNLNSSNQIEAEIQDSVDEVLGDINNVSSNITSSNAQSILDPLQVTAALYGKPFWFLYNYFQGTASTECGWTPTSVTQGTSIATSLSSQGLSAAILNEDLFDKKYQAYFDYGQKIAGKYYVSNEVLNIDDMQTYQWYNISDGQIFDFTSTFADALKIKMEYGLSQDGSVQTIPGTIINQYYDGIKYVGNVMYYQDSTFSVTQGYIIDPITNSQINQYYDQLIGLEGGQSLDFSELTINPGSTSQLQKYIGYTDIQSVPVAIQGIISQLKSASESLQPQFSTFNVIGIKKDDLSNLKAVNGLPATINIIDVGTQSPGATPPQTFSNNSILRIPKNGGYILYYDKIANCISAYSDGDYYLHKFSTKNASSDIPTPDTLTFVNSNGQTQYALSRNLSSVNNIFNTNILNGLVTPRTFHTIEVKYKFNYLNASMLSMNPLTNGMTSLQIDIGDSEVSSTFTFSNKTLKVPEEEALLEKLEMQFKNSWKRTYFPKTVAT
jgi:hypothetical protein